MSDASTWVAAFVRGFVPISEACGIDPEPMFASVGLSLDDLADPDGRVPMETFLGLWDWVHEHVPADSDYGFVMGSMFRPELLGVVGYALAHSADIAEVLARVQRFRALTNPMITPRVERRGAEVALALRYPPRMARIRFVGESTVFAYVTLIEQLSGVRPRLCEARFQHARPADVARYQEVFRCPLVFDSDETTLTLPADVLALRVRRADPQLCAYLEDHARRLLERLPREQRLSDSVRRLVADELRGGDPGQAHIARRLAMSERTLQRRLKEEGVTFAELADEMRRETALIYLEDPRMAVYEVAYLLGYAEPSAFYRAFKRWTGETPQAWRSRAA